MSFIRLQPSGSQFHIRHEDLAFEQLLEPGIFTTTSIGQYMGGSRAPRGN